MAEALRYFADQHLPRPVVDGLRRRGVEILTAQEAGRCTLPDSDQLAFAATEGRVLVTFDPDFLALHQAGTSHAGIAWCPATKYGIGQLIQMLLLLRSVVSSEEMVNHVEYL